jgi:hypothetical protein
LAVPDDLSPFQKKATARRLGSQAFTNQIVLLITYLGVSDVKCSDLFGRGAVRFDQDFYFKTMEASSLTYGKEAAWEFS